MGTGKYAMIDSEETHSVEFRTEADSGYGIYVGGIYIGRLGKLRVDNVNAVFRIVLGELFEEIPGVVEMVELRSESFIEGWERARQSEVARRRMAGWRPGSDEQVEGRVGGRTKIRTYEEFKETVLEATDHFFHPVFMSEEDEEDACRGLWNRLGYRKMSSVQRG